VHVGLRCLIQDALINRCGQITLPESKSEPTDLTTTTPVVAPSDYRVFVSRSGKPRKETLWRIFVRQQLPTIAVPLKGKEADLMHDPDAMSKENYKRSAYERVVDYRKAPIPALSVVDAIGAAKLLRSKRLRQVLDAIGAAAAEVVIGQKQNRKHEQRTDCIRHSRFRFCLELALAQYCFRISCLNWFGSNFGLMTMSLK
jgi:hypothetical protein